MISLAVDCAKKVFRIDVCVRAQASELNLDFPTNTGKLCNVEGAIRWNQSGNIECEVGALLRWCWTDYVLTFDVHPQDTNRPPGIASETSRTFPCGFFSPPWCPIDQAHASVIEKVRIKSYGSESILTSNRRATPTTDDWTIFSGNADFLIIIGDFTVKFHGPWRISYPRTLGVTFSPCVARRLRDLEGAAGRGNPVNLEKPDLVFLPLPFLQPEAPSDCCWGQGGNWYIVGSMCVFDLQFLGQSDPIFGDDFRNKRHAMYRALGSFYMRPQGPSDLWIVEALSVVLADIAEGHLIDYGTLEIRIAERARLCMSLPDKPLLNCLDAMHCARKGSLVLHEARRLGVDVTKLLADPTWTLLSELLTQAGVQAKNFWIMWINGVSYPVVSISYVFAARSAKLEMTLERSTMNQSPVSSQWEGGISFEIWGYKKRKEKKKVDDSDEKEMRLERLDTKTLNFVAGGPSKLEGTLAIAGEFVCVKVTDVWIAADIHVEQTQKAWISALRTRCGALPQWWIVHELRALQCYKKLEQIIHSKEIHYLIRRLAVSEMCAAGQAESLIEFCESPHRGPSGKPALFAALAYIGQLELPAATEFIAKNISLDNPWESAAMIGQSAGQPHAKQLCRTLVDRQLVDPHGILMAKCVQTLEDTSLATELLQRVAPQTNTCLAWRVWKRFCPESRSWQVAGQPPTDATNEPGYRHPRVVRKRALLLLQKEDSKRQPTPALYVPTILQNTPTSLKSIDDIQQWLWIAETCSADSPYDIDIDAVSAHPMLRPALTRLKTPALTDDDIRQASWEKNAILAIRQMCSYSNSFHFRAPLPKEFMDKFYSRKIAFPMDLTTVQNKLIEHRYRYQYEFVEDVELIWKNAEMFNGADSEIGVRAARCRTHFEALYGRPSRSPLHYSTNG